MSRLKVFVKEENGGALLSMLPYIITMYMVLLAFTLNILIWSSGSNQLQAVADSVSRAGTLAIHKQYAVRESIVGDWASGYHVYIELDHAGADKLAQKTLDAWQGYTRDVDIYEREYNPEGIRKNLVWDSLHRRYYEEYLDSRQQYKNGDFSVRLKAKLPSLWGSMLMLPEELDICGFSRSGARGNVK